jgi:hypothetical protein
MKGKLMVKGDMANRIIAECMIIFAGLIYVARGFGRLRELS